MEIPELRNTTKINLIDEFDGRLNIVKLENQWTGKQNRRKSRMKSRERKGPIYIKENKRERDSYTFFGVPERREMER